MVLALLLLGGLATFVVWLAASGVATQVGTELAHRWLNLSSTVRSAMWATCCGAGVALTALGIRRRQRKKGVAAVADLRTVGPRTRLRPSAHPPTPVDSFEAKHPQHAHDGSRAWLAVERERYGPQPEKHADPKPSHVTRLAQEPPDEARDRGREQRGGDAEERRSAPEQARGAANPRKPPPLSLLDVPRDPAPATILSRAATDQASAVLTPAPPPPPKRELPEPPAARSVVGSSPAAAVQGQDAAQQATPLTAPLAAIRRFVFGSGSPSTTSTTPTELADRLWYPQGRSVRVGSDLIPDGMLYVGEGLPSVSGGFATEAALLDPKLPRALSPAGVAPNIPYWPNYAGLSPEARGYYVRWLLNGRCDPATPVGYVFLFFYGIERRLLADSESSESARSETPALLAEVERLLTIYGQNGSFRSYATDFLNTIRAERGLEVPLDLTSTLSGRSPELPLGIRVGVGRFIAAAQPIPADWALAWVCRDPETRLGTVARRCRDELRELFKHRYQAEFGAGMTLEPNKTRLALAYRCASPSFAGSTVTVRVGDLPDIAPLSKPVNSLRTLLESCADDLEGFSRLLGRSPAEASSIRALALLPKELVLSRETPELTELRDWLEGLVPADEPRLVVARELFSRLALDSAEIKKTDATDTARLLERLGVGTSPMRFGTRGVPKLDEPIAFAGLRARKAFRPAHSTCRRGGVLRLAAEVAACDDEINEAEQQELEAQLERALDLDPGERRRLRAHLKWLVVARPGFAGLKKHLERLDAGGRSRIAQYAVAIAAADGHVDSAEIKTLQKIYRALELEPDQVFAHVHDAQAMPTRVPTEPVTIREADPAPPGFRVPDASPISREGVLLDRRAIERKLAETAEVSSLLSRIFVDDEATAAPSSVCGPHDSAAQAPDTPAAVVVAGLDGAGTALLRALADLQSIGRSDFEALAAERGMLPDGAIEALNEAAFRRCDEPALEGDDPIEVNAAVIKEMLR
ncbi:MAG: TerB N-terminal domain-containing protein [bacterium]